MACSGENRAYSEAMATKKPLDQMKELRENVDKCVTKHFQGTSQKCGDEFEAVVACLETNQRQWSKCVLLKTALEECFAKNVL